MPNFGTDFKWGITTSAVQTEGSFNIDGKSLNIWDTFSFKKGNIRGNENHFKSCDFYNRYKEDLLAIKLLNFNSFRFSISWSRILPQLNGYPNQKGIDFYNKMIDFALELGIEPIATLYHWDLPQYMDDIGGWTNRDVVGRMNDFAEIAVKSFGDRVKTWIPLNEPLVFTTAGYLLGLHAPGKKGLANYLPAVYNAIRCNAETSLCIKSMDASFKVGSSFSLTPAIAHTNKPKDVKAQKKINTALNQIFLDPYLGFDIPTKELPLLKKIDKYRKPEDIISFNADFIGVQNYTQEVVKHKWYKPPLYADIVLAKERNVAVSQMNWEINPNAISLVFNQLKKYPNLPDIYITECGVAVPNEQRIANKVYDIERINYYKALFKNIHNAIQNDIPVKGIYLWTLNDNFEWAEGYFPKFGISEIDPISQRRILKHSAQWLQEFLVNQMENSAVSST